MKFRITIAFTILETKRSHSQQLEAYVDTQYFFYDV